MSPSAEDRTAARLARQRAWHHQNLARIMADPERYAKMRAQKNAARARAREEAKRRLPDAINADLYRVHGPWAPLFVIQQAQV